jgi:hypothetical protein
MAHYLYVISPTVSGIPVSPCKIGISNKPRARLSGIQTGNPERLALVAAVPMGDRTVIECLEASMHDYLAEHRLQGEWFNVSPVDAACLACVMLYDSCIQLGMTEAEALENMKRQNVTDVLKSTMEFIDACLADGLPLETKFRRSSAFH